ncbi:MAG: hypothetical protein NZR01_07765 [Bryobacteraceae bacterium]|nr:hypothetical protein [Bryobacteraceae bacterium]
MGSFDGKTKTKTRVEIGKDAWKPKMGALGKGSQTDEALIHGTKKEQIDVNLISTVTVNRTFQTNVNFQCTVGAMRKLQDTIFMHATNGLHKRDVTGPSLVNRVGPTLNTFVSPLTENHSAPRMMNEPTSNMNNIVSFLKTFIDEKNIGLNSSEAYANKFALSGLNNDHKAIANGIVGLELKLAGTCLGVEVYESRTVPLIQRTNPLEARIGAIKSELAALETHTGVKLSNLKFAVNSFTM